MPGQQAPAGRLGWTLDFPFEKPPSNAPTSLARDAARLTGWRTMALKRRTLADRIGMLVSAGPVVDVCCGDGSELARLPSHIRPVGIAVTAAVAERARHNLKGRTAHIVAAGAVEGLRSLDSDSCHGAILRSCLEYEAEPRQVLEQLGRVLVSGGVALVKVPNFASLNRIVMGRRWRGFRHPDQLNHFTPSGLRLIAAVAGFDIQIAFLDALPTGDNLIATLVNTKRPQPMRDLLPVESAPDGPLIVYSIDPTGPIPASAGPAAGERGNEPSPMPALSGHGAVA